MDALAQVHREEDIRFEICKMLIECNSKLTAKEIIDRADTIFTYVKSSNLAPKPSNLKTVASLHGGKPYGG